MLIFGGIALAWVVYFATAFRRGRNPEQDAAARLAAAVPVFRDHPDGLVVDQDLNPIELSTPLTRRAELAEIRRIDRTAARRRRYVTLASLGLVLTVVVLAATGYVPWWAVAVPGVVLVALLAFTRLSVRVLRRQLDERFAAVHKGHDEATVAVGEDAGEKDDKAAEVEVTTASPLWDPLPITRPTYVSKPLAPRTVRTIDLSAPASPVSPTPVTADRDDGTDASKQQTVSRRPVVASDEGAPDSRSERRSA